MIVKPRSPRGGGERQRLGQPAGLVELDVDGVVFAGEAVEVAVVWQASSAQTGIGCGTVRQRLVVIGRQRLLDQLHPEPGQRRHDLRQVALAPAFVGIDDQPRRRRGLAHRAHPLDVAVAAQLQLQQRPVPLRRGGLAHPLRRVEAQRVGGDDRPHRGDAGEVGGAAVVALGVEIPERAVERVARRAGRHRALQFTPVEPGKHRALHRFERGDDALDALAIARIGHAFAAAAKLAVEDLGDDDLGAGLAAARDRERRRQRPGPARDRETLRVRRHAGSAGQPIDDRADPGAHRIDAGQAQLVLGAAQIVARRRRVEPGGVDADADTADRRVGQLRRLDIALRCTA